MNWTFFAGSRMTPATPVVQRLAAASDAVLLFCPVAPGVLRGPAEPYVCGGRCRYLSHDETRVPLRFRFALPDWPRLAASGTFEQVLQDAGAAVVD